METGTLRTVPFKDVYEAIVSRLGLDPSLPVPHNLWQAIPRGVNKRLRTAWTYWEWPYLEVCDERAFARTWLSDHQFVPGETVIYVGDLKYYKVKESIDVAPPIGTPPTNTTYWLPVTDYGNFIPFDQKCRRPMGMVLGVYPGDPRMNGHGHSSSCFRPEGNGITCHGGPTVFLKYQLPVPRFSLTPYAPGRIYQIGTLVYDSISGDCYIAVALNQNEPPPNGLFWSRQEFPAVFEDYVVAATYASCLKETNQAPEAADQQQMRIMWARDAEQEAEDKLVEEIDKLRAMGQHYHYQTWRRASYSMGRGYCAGVCFDPTAGGILEPPVTTLKQICETDPTAYQPPPVDPGEPPGGGPGIEIINGVTQLVEGQAYIDVTFLVPQDNTNWIFVECHVVNTTDPTPLNIWPGILTNKTATGFRIQLNGTPDSANYYLHWAVTGGAAAPPTTDATTYSLGGPSSGSVGVASTNFTVQLPAGTTVPAPVTVTPADGSGGGTFTPTSVTLSTGAPSATFKYTPASAGAKTISVTNSGGLTNPANRTYTASVSTAATTYTLTGPSAGTVGVASTNFTVALPGGSTVAAPVTVTPSAGGGGGTFTPTSVNLTTAAPSATFTYTPASAGAKTISVTNSGGLTNPANLTYTAAAAGLADGDPVSTWPDSSSNGNNATMTGSARPIYKTAIVNGKPVVRFTTAGASGMNLTTPISGASPFSMFAVMKPLGTASLDVCSLASSTDSSAIGLAFVAAGAYVLIASKDSAVVQANTYSGAFHIFFGSVATGAGALYVDGTLVTATAGPQSLTGDLDRLGYRPFDAELSDGDIAEIIIYNTVLSAGDRNNVFEGLAIKYGVSGGFGTPVAPNTVTGIKGWWKADSL
jgi:hypothetical protein